jgi:phosphatidylserine/phosphatidylglycerophosphate/cardiolipin synthase-like enzyme
VEVASYFRERWRRATDGEELELPVVDGAAPQMKPSVTLAARHVALSENRPKTLADADSAQEIRQLYLDAIAAAEELIYLENQYFSSQAVFQALLDRMRAPDRPRLEIVIVLPKQLPSWVETVAMGPPHLTMLDGLREAARQTGHRLGFYYSAAVADDGREFPVLIHSKLLLVDDRFLTIGSTNASNRSMGLDTELNVSFEVTSPEDRELVRSIRRVRVSLLAEHAGLRRLGERRELKRRQGLVDHLDRLASGAQHRLRHLTREAVLEDRDWLASLERWGFSFDPEKPLIEEELHALIR